MQFNTAETPKAFENHRIFKGLRRWDRAPASRYWALRSISILLKLIISLNHFPPLYKTAEQYHSLLSCSERHLGKRCIRMRELTAKLQQLNDNNTHPSQSGTNAALRIISSICASARHDLYSFRNYESSQRYGSFGHFKQIYAESIIKYSGRLINAEMVPWLFCIPLIISRIISLLFKAFNIFIYHAETVPRPIVHLSSAG